MSGDETRPKALRPTATASGPNKRVLVVAIGFALVTIVLVFQAMLPKGQEAVQVAQTAPEEEATAVPPTARPEILDAPLTELEADDPTAAGETGELAGAPGGVPPPMPQQGAVGPTGGRAYSEVQSGAPPGSGQASGGVGAQENGSSAPDPRETRHEAYTRALRAPLVQKVEMERPGAAEQAPATPFERDRSERGAIETPVEAQPAVQSEARGSRSQPAVMTEGHRPAYVAPPTPSEPYRPRVLRPGEAGAPNPGGARDPNS